MPIRSVFDRFEEIKPSIAEKIERNSVSISVISSLDESGITINNATVLGGQDLIRDENIRLEAEAGFVQLNIVDLFELRKHVLHSIKYAPEQVIGTTDLVSNIYQVKSAKGSTYYLGLLVTPYHDINLTKYEQFIDFACSSYYGTLHRAITQMKNGQITEKRVYEDLEATSSSIMSLLAHLLFKRRELAGGPESIGVQTYFFGLLIFDYKIVPPKRICLNDSCKSVFELDEVDSDKCPKCGSDLSYLPPDVEFKDVSLVFPKEAIKYLVENYEVPRDIVSLYELSRLPSSVLLSINLLNPDIFSNYVYLPSRAVLVHRNKKDVLTIDALSKRVGDKIRVVVALTDSVPKTENLIGFMPMRTFLRDLREGFGKNVTIEEILDKSIVSNWLRTPFFKPNDASLDDFNAFFEIIGVKYPLQSSDETTEEVLDTNIESENMTESVPLDENDSKDGDGPAHL